MKKRTWRFLILISVCAALSGCALKTVKTVEMGDEMNRGSRILIATQSSEFKETVISGVVHALERDPCYIKMIDVTKLAEESADRYDAIVIVNTCMAYRLNESALKFLDNVGDKEKIILLTTAADERKEYHPVEVDAITSASRMSKADEIAGAIVVKVRALLETDP
ncbi:MAG: hypothetical protein GY859_15565 [Desulfobacterales bacterium]|nr:hypothetical protein [Desulfobacterales bacterium]